MNAATLVVLAMVGALAAATPLEAQTDSIHSSSSSITASTAPRSSSSRLTTASSPPAGSRVSIRPFVAASMQRFAADTTFDAVFGSAAGGFVGGGVVATRGWLFVEAAVSRFRREGERAFASAEGGSGVGIPLTVTIVPTEFAAGYRFRSGGFAITPYVGAGLGIYRYREQSPSAEPGEDLDVRHAGWLLVVGAERRLHRHVAVTADLRYTHVPGIFGQGGLSQAVGESNLGGIAARVRVMLGP